MPSDGVPVSHDTSRTIEPAPVQPQERARRLHPLTVLFAALRLGRQLVLPALVGGISRADGDPGRLVGWVAGILAVPAVVISALRYATFRYRLGADELVIDSGVLQRQHRVIPLSRVQNIDLRESALQRACGVVEVHVETAGSGRSAEAALVVLGRADAEAFREELLARRRALKEHVDERAALTAAGAPAIADVPIQLLAHLSARRLALGGATANEAGLIAAGLAAGIQFIDDFALQRFVPLLDIESQLAGATLAGAVWLVMLAIMSLILLGWIVSIVGAVIGYHDFTLERSGEELRKRFGLLGRRQTTLPLERVQGVRLEESLLRRPLGLVSLKIESAGGSPGEQRRKGAEAFVPIARSAEVPALLRGVFADLDLAGVRFHRVHPRSRRRSFLRYVVIVLVLLAMAGAAGYLRTGNLPAQLLWWTPVLVATSWGFAAWQYVHRGYALLPGYVLARAGVLNRVTRIVPDRKIQSVHRTATPFQRRHGLSSLIVDTASGGRQGRVADLGDAEAQSLVEELARRARRTTRTGRGSEEPDQPDQTRM